MSRSIDNVRFNVLRNALYHTAQRMRFDRWTRIFNFLVLMLGASAMTDAIGELGIGTIWIGAAIVLVCTLQLVFDFAGRARDHQSLQRDYYRLLADIEAAPDATEEQCARWWSEIIRIGLNAAPVLRALDAKAYNDALDALGTFDQSERLVIPWTHRIFGGFRAFEGYNYRKISEAAG